MRPLCTRQWSEGFSRRYFIFIANSALPNYKYTYRLHRPLSPFVFCHRRISRINGEGDGDKIAEDTRGKDINKLLASRFAPHYDFRRLVNSHFRTKNTHQTIKILMESPSTRPEYGRVRKKLAPNRTGFERSSFREIPRGKLLQTMHSSMTWRP